MFNDFLQACYFERFRPRYRKARTNRLRMPAGMAATISRLRPPTALLSFTASYLSVLACRRLNSLVKM
jgi:hypothetical protein